MAPPRTGGSGKKSRGGCKTCKLRRVKCDETKPFCTRCKDLHIVCDGYVVKVVKTKGVGGSFFPILPKEQTALPAVVPLINKPPHLLIEPSPRLPVSETESCYFKVFRERTASSLAEYLDTNIWNRIVLQATEYSTPIKHAVIALGALHKALDGGPYPSMHADDRLQPTEHYQFALQQYGKALRLTRVSCLDHHVDTRALLISCFLSICFECIHGSTDTAVAHIQSGVMVLDEACRNMGSRISTSQSQSLPGFLEDEMLSVLTRLESDVFALYETEQHVMSPELESVVMQMLRLMPLDNFESFTSARKYLDLLLREIGWFVIARNGEQWKLASEVTSEGAIDPDIVLGRTVAKDALVAEFKQLLARWTNTFQSLVERSKESRDKDALLATTALGLRVTCSSISLSCYYGPETSYDTFLPEFEKALALAEILHHSGPSSKSTRPTFITSSVLIRSLHFICLKCRYSPVRKRALAMLKAMPRREGIWDAKFISIVSEVVMEMEEGGEEEGMIEEEERQTRDDSRRSMLPPESKRLKAIKTSFDLYKRKGEKNVSW